MRTRKSEIIGAVGTLAVHIAVIIFLYLMFIHKPDMTGESGVPVMLGNVEMAKGMFDPNTMTEVDIQPEPVATPEEVVPQESEQEMITQTEEETVAIKPKAEPKPKKETPKKKEEKKKPVEKTEAEKRAEREKAAAEAANKAIAGAFGKGAQMGSKGNATTGTGVQGRKDGSISGTMMGNKGNGMSISGLDGRYSKESYVMPEKSDKYSGTVAVDILVDSKGVVKRASINLKRTDTPEKSLRDAALVAAKRARFKVIDKDVDQVGVITYEFTF